MQNQSAVTILADNQAGEGFLQEHGLSLWIETPTRRILFDTGQGKALEFNAPALGVDLSQTDVLVLSHGHYDHTGGILHVLKQARPIEVYAHPGVIQNRYSIRDGIAKPVQIPREARAALDQLPARNLHWVTEAVWLDEDIGITGPIPRQTPYEDPGGPFYLDPEGQHADLIEDDLSLWIQTRKGLVICAGCCHAGLVNTLNHIRRLTQHDHIHAVIGGFHLLNANARRLEQTLAALRSFSPEWVVPCHCTGDLAIEALKTAFSGRMTTGHVGARYDI